MWQVIYIAANQQTAEKIRHALSAEGILVSLRPLGLSSPTGNNQVELLVSKAEAQEAQEALHVVLGRFR